MNGITVYGGHLIKILRVKVAWYMVGTFLFEGIEPLTSVQVIADLDQRFHTLRKKSPGILECHVEP